MEASSLVDVRLSYKSLDISFNRVAKARVGMEKDIVYSRTKSHAKGASHLGRERPKGNI
jgi:hypothetical protein